MSNYRRKQRKGVSSYTPNSLNWNALENASVESTLRDLQELPLQQFLEPPLDELITTEDDNENLDNEEIDKQLVMWAGRLELESIDLREKSKGLIGELFTNSEHLQSATNEIHGAIEALKSSKNTEKTMPVDLKKILVKLTDIQNLQRQTSDKELLKRLDRLSSDITTIWNKSHSRPLISKAAISDLAPKLTKIIEFNKSHEKLLEDQSGQLSLLRSELKELSKSINHVNTLQVTFSAQLIQLTKSQECMKKELRSLKQSIPGESAVPLTPESSMVSKPAIYTRRYRSQQRSRMERRVVQSQSQPHNRDSYISLLSDDIIET